MFYSIYVKIVGDDVGHTVPGMCVGGVESVPDWKTAGEQRGSGWRIQE